MYYIMSSQFDAFNNPDIAKYDDDKWVISGVSPKNFTGEIVDLTLSELTNDEFTAQIDIMRAQEPTGRLLIIRKEHGQHIHKTHPAFMPDNEDM